MARVLVRDDVNRLYWSDSEGWVAEVAAAWEFQTLHEAALKALGDRARTTRSFWPKRIRSTHWR